MAYDTLESAQARIVELDEEVKTLKGEKDTLFENNKKLTEDNKNLRAINQNYFNRLIAQDTKEDKEHKEDKEDTTPSCVDFAKNLSI